MKEPTHKWIQLLFLITNELSDHIDRYEEENKKEGVEDLVIRLLEDYFKTKEG